MHRIQQITQQRQVSSCYPYRTPELKFYFINLLQRSSLVNLPNLLVGKSSLFIPFLQFLCATYHKKQGTMPHPHDITRFANILFAYSCNTFIKKKGTSSEDFEVLHVLLFIVDLAPMLSSLAECLDGFTAASNE